MSMFFEISCLKEQPTRSLAWSLLARFMVLGSTASSYTNGLVIITKTYYVPCMKRILLTAIHTNLENLWIVNPSSRSPIDMEVQRLGLPLWQG